ncbi:MAG: hypothetical protein WKI04_01675 [Ferruginibacter sp.]
MRKSILTLISLLVLIQLVFPQSLRQPISAIYLGLGAYSTKHTDVFSFVNNQAVLAQAEDLAAGVYGERRFLLEATSLYTAAIAIPSKSGNFGISLKYAGFKSFNESQVGLAYARNLGSRLDIGIQFNYYSYRVPSYINANTVNVEIGALLHLTEQLNLGIHVYNPVGGNFAGIEEKLTAAYKVGLGYDASESFFLSAEVVKEEGYPGNVNAGVQYQFAKQLFARAGISSASSATYAGVGISWSKLRIDISGSYHPQLGWSPGLLLIMNFGGSPDHILPARGGTGATNPILP